MNWIFWIYIFGYWIYIWNFASWYHQSFWILNTTAIWIVYLAVFQLERQRLQNFIDGSERQDNGPLELLHFIQQFKLSISVKNIVLMLRIFDDWIVASCDRSFSNLKLIKNYLRSTISDARLINLTILSIERELSDEIDFDDVISEFAARKARKIRL